jgi:hypothetical protein
MNGRPSMKAARAHFRIRSRRSVTMPQLMANGGRPQSEAGQWRLSFTQYTQHAADATGRADDHTIA